ncbi:ubiquitin carboxyl-terminal hydrolase 26 [Talpa occidentalis]|uniref:ubiquitin carboxyl-terminal hydrolase 26 n=1 Tax=Talpa occidentalis TaxID=50954 RepID=UPI00188E394F|nr:ubiquitin carboxyl-terminal hydrolase 26 [Talpa occidentalis]XP_037367820.1 ubiquitin carboxyl-terminal hydrolase 26 [Talpa occidentalis]XP_054551526.1 ubiquitin carboxyl-terminal hydrolase 26 [Talpa occidentalis]
MDSLMIHGFVQMWTRDAGMSKSKEAFIETVDGKKVKLVIYLKSGGHTTVQLSNNIKNVFHRSYGDNQEHLHLIFKNNNLLFIEKLSSTDAKELKRFLDKVHQKRLQPSLEPNSDVSITTSTTKQKKNKTSPSKVCKKSDSESFETGEGNVVPNHQAMPLFTSIASTLTHGELEIQCEKRKLSSDSEMNQIFMGGNESVILKKSKRNPFGYGNYSVKKEWRKNKILGFKPSFKFKSTGNAYLDGIGLLHTLSEKIHLALLSDPKNNEDEPAWEGFEITLDIYPEKLWQGLPNLGNTCYMNAVLQSLFSIPPFANDLLSWGFPWGKSSLDALSLCLAQLLALKDIYNVKIKERLLVNIKTALSAVAGIYSDNVQNDAHEFLGHCLDQMKENVENFNNIEKTESKSGEENSPQQVFAGSAVTGVFSCPVITNFEFELLSSIICKTCGHVVLKTEQSNYLSVNLPQGPKAHPLSIQSTFDLFFKAEELEYTCEKCEHKRSIAVHKFSRLPRVLIVHLKRYNFNEFWSLRKDDREVVISKYLHLSSLCNGNTKPPLPLAKNIRVRDLQVLKIFRKMTSKAAFFSKISRKLAAKSKDFLAPHFGSTKASEPQKGQTPHKGSSREEQQEHLEKYSKLNTMETKLVNGRVGANTEKGLLAAGSVINGKDPSLSLIHEGEGESTSIPGTCPAEVYLKEVLENPKPKKCEEKNIFEELNCENFTETTKDFHEDEIKKVAEQKRQQEGMRLFEEVFRESLLQNCPELDSLCSMENLRRPADCSYQDANGSSLGASGSSKNPRNKDFLDLGKAGKASAEKTNGNPEGDKHAYRLIGVVSHLGKTPNSGHYISDAYDFERQVWFTYNDLQVSSIQEGPMQAARLCTGYIFFYMHNEIFKKLLGRKQNFKSRHARTRDTYEQK